MKSGIIFGNGGVGQVRVARVKWWLKLTAQTLRKGGKWITAAGLIGVVLILWPVVQAELKYAFGQTGPGRAIVKLTNTELEFVVEGKDELVTDWKVPDEDYSVYIPKILAKSRVIPNVDPGEKQEYQWALKLGVAEAAGLAHPGQKGTTYLFAHSVGTRADFARYNAIFYLLHKLETGDGVEVVYQGKLYKYEVVAKEILAAGDLKYLQPQTSEERLVMQTCYPPGTAWKRLVVIAKRSQI